MSKDWLRGQGYVDVPKSTPELGVGKDGYQTGGVKIEATDPNETQTVTVKGTKRMRADKKPVKAQVVLNGLVWSSKNSPTSGR